MMDIIKKMIPKNLLKWIRPWYHGFLAWDANIYYDRPSERLIVIGITGTAGKSTTAAMLSYVLNFAGLKTGYITTVEFFDGNRNFVNKHGLSMPNEIKLQRQLHAMAINKCKYAIIECTSEGLAQNRHWGLILMWPYLPTSHTRIWMPTADLKVIGRQKAGCLPV